MTSDTDHSGPGLKRRDFLKAASLAGAAVAAAPAVSTAVAAKESRQEQLKARYKETDHVKQYYALNRL